jgi:hypothetical protein
MIIFAGYSEVFDLKSRINDVEITVVLSFNIAAPHNRDVIDCGGLFLVTFLGKQKSDRK